MAIGSEAPRRTRRTVKKNTHTSGCDPARLERCGNTELRTGNEPSWRGVAFLPKGPYKCSPAAVYCDDSHCEVYCEDNDLVTFAETVVSNTSL